MKQKFLSIFLALAVCLALLSVTAAAEETETRYLWQADNGTIYWSTTAPSDLATSGDGTALTETTLTVGSTSYQVYTLPEGSYQMREDITLNGTLYANSNITLDLNGYVLALSESAASGSLINMQSGDLTLKSSNTTTEHKFDTSPESGVWTLAASDATGENIRTVTGGVLTGGKGMKVDSDSNAVIFGGAVCVVSGGFTMENCNIVGCTADAGGAVYVKTGTGNTFTMTDSNIKGCTATDTDNSGGGAISSGVPFTMTDSLIEACTSKFHGGGIYALGSVTLKSGSQIKDCKGTDGGGVWAYKAFQMDSGASIEGCTASSNGGGVHLVSGSGNSNTMAGTITGCKATRCGGGVYLDFGSERVLTISGTIEGCTAQSGGGVYLPSASDLATKTVILNGGTISGCTATENGGGVFVDGNTLLATNTFELRSGTIQNCTAKNGGGVYLGGTLAAIQKYPTFTMSGGSITGCNASECGGGVYAEGGDTDNSSLNSTVNLNGGSITGNNATQSGGGIYVATSQVTVNGSVTVTDNFVGGTKDTASDVYVKGESGTDNNLFLAETYTLYWLAVSGGQIGLSLPDINQSEGATVVTGGGLTDSPKYCVFDAGDEWALYIESTTFKVGKKTILLTHEGSSTEYVKFADAYNDAQIGDTLQLLAEIAGTMSISKALTLDLNGHNVYALSVRVPATITNSAGGGVIGTLKIDAADVTVGDLLATGYGFTNGSTEWLDSTCTDKELSYVTVQQLPITSVTVTADDAKKNANGNYVYTYGDTYDNGYVTTTIVQPEDGEQLTCKYYVVSQGNSQETDHNFVTGEATDTDTYYLSAMTVNNRNLSAGEYTIQVRATKDGYTLESDPITVEIVKGTLTNYTAPTAVSDDLTYTGSEQALITEGSATGGTFYYRLGENGNWSTDVPKGTNAGEYKVYWKIEESDNYLGYSPDSPITVTIAKATPTITTAPTATATYGQKLSDITLTNPDGNTNGTWSWVDGTQPVGDASDTAKTFYATFIPNDSTNYNTVDNVAVSVTVNKATLTYTAPTAKNTIDYNGSAQQLIATAGTVTNGTFWYRLGENGTWTTDAATITATNAGSYTIYYYIVGDANHNDVGSTSEPAGHVAASIQQIDFATNCTVTLSQTSYTYDGTAKTPIVTVTYNGIRLIEDTDYMLTGDISKTTVEAFYRIQVEATQNSNFSGQKQMDWYITAAPLTISGVTAEDKIYNGLNTAIVTVTFSGLVNNETLTEGTDYTVTSRFDDANAGTNKTVNAVVKLESTNTTKNYVLNTATAATTATISPKPVGLTWSDTSLTYNGSAQAPAATATGLVNGDACVVTVSGAQTDAGNNYTATATGLNNSNYKLPTNATTSFSIAQAAARTLSDIPVSLKYTVTGEQSVQIGSVMPTDAGTLTYSVGEPAMSDTAHVTSFTVSNTGLVKFAVTGIAGNVITLPVKINSTNYEESTVNVVITLTEKDAQGPLTITSGTSVTYGQTLTLTTAGGSGTGEVAYEVVSGGTGEATINGNTLTATKVGTVQIKATKAADDNYASVESAVVTITIAKATPTGAPKYTAITTSGKTLADAALTVNESWPDGSVQWVDENGAALDSTTAVEANTSYQWKFTPTDSTNYNDINGTIELWHKSTSSGGGGGSSTPSGSTVTVPVTSDHDSVEVKAEVSKGNATVEVSDKQIESVIADGAGEVTLDVSGLKNVDSATVPAHVVEKTNEAEDTGLTVSLPTGSVTLDETALESVTEAAGGEDVTVSVVSVPTSALPPVVKDIIGMDSTVAAVVDVNVTVNGQKQSSFNGGKVTVAIPYTPQKGEDTSKLTVWYITDSGRIENKGGYYDADKKCFVFETNHLSQYLLVSVENLPQFEDVPANAYYADAVTWAVLNGITTGMTDTTFGPDLSCTRAQLVTFLWRAAGQPEPGEVTNPFTDVTERDYFYNAVLWAVENGITTGVTETMFAPDATCTRAQAAAFIYRYEQANGGGFTGNWMFQLPFTDVPEWCYEAVAWCYTNGITKGTSATTFLPDNDCTRAQIVTMLYRLLGQ